MVTKTYNDDWRRRRRRSPFESLRTVNGNNHYSRTLDEAERCHQLKMKRRKQKKLLVRRVQILLATLLLILILWGMKTSGATTEGSDRSRTRKVKQVKPASSSTSLSQGIHEKGGSYKAQRHPLPASDDDEGRSVKLSPFTSHPPDPIPLFQEGLSESVVQRHKCINRIRKRQTEELGPLLPHASNILLVDPAYHANVGDHMITVGELEFLKGRHINQCSYVQARDYVPRCDDVLSQSRNNNATIAVWHGGGNWGDLWRAAQEPRIESFAPLLSAGYTIVSMPQSLYYVDDDALQKEDTQRIAGAISRGLLKHTTDDHLEDIAAYLKTGKDRQMASKRVVFTWRERESYDRAVELYPFATNKLVPDMAFQLGPYAPMIRDDEPRTDLVLLLRSDHESVVASQRSRESIRKILRSTPGGESLTFSVVDWEDRLERFESDDFFFTNTSIQLLSAGRVVVCDRLHAAILAYLVGLPFVFVDQVSGKITKTFEVAFDGEQSCQDGEAAMWARATNLTSAIAQSAGFLVKYQLQGNQRRRRRSVSAR